MESTTRFERTGDEQSVGELVQAMSQQTATLVRQELRLAHGGAAGEGQARRPGRRDVRRCRARGALRASGALIAAAIIGLGTLLEPWIAAVIVGAVLLAVAGILALSGKRKVDEATPPLPEQALESTKRDVDEVKNARARA